MKLVKLVKLTAGKGAVYETEDKRVCVLRMEEYRNMRKTIGWKGNVVEYKAVLRQVTDLSDEIRFVVAKGNTLAQLRERLTAYLADEAAGTLGERHRYGFKLDRRPVARVAAVPAAEVSP